MNDENRADDEQPTEKVTKMTLKTSDRRSCTENASNLKIVSWNVNGIRAWLNSGACKYLEKEQADIICLQVEYRF